LFNTRRAEGSANPAHRGEIASMHKLHPVFALALLATCLHARTVNVSPSGSASGTGTASSPLAVGTAFANAKAGDTILLAAGTYAIPYTTGSANTILCATKATKEAPIVVQAPAGQRATLDFQFPKDAWVQDSYGLSLTGNWWQFQRIAITRAGYQGVYVTGSYNSFENCAFYENRNSGIEINKGGSYTTLRNCDAYRNYDPKKLGTMADGFAPKQTQGPGNRLIGCRAWENSDDGYDAYDSPEIVVFDSCLAFRNGLDVLGYGAVGNGNGFKIGGLQQPAPDTLRHCVSFGNPLKGFDQNNNTAGLTLVHCTGYLNGTNFGLGGALTTGKHVLRNCVSYKGTNADAFGSATQEKNSWNLSLSLGSSDFESLDTSLARAPRTSDGSIPRNALFRPSASSKLLDRGAVLLWSYAGSAPDLGAFERPSATSVAPSSRFTARSTLGRIELTSGGMASRDLDLLGRRGNAGSGIHLPLAAPNSAD